MIKGFKMKLYPGQETEYEKRHNELWQEMKAKKKQFMRYLISYMKMKIFKLT